MEQAINNENVQYCSLDKYRSVIKAVSKEVMEIVSSWGNHYIDDFMEYIKDNQIEELRSKEEYSLEFMLIGILTLEYVDNARAFKNISSITFKFLNKLRGKRPGSKNKFDNIRGWLSENVLFKSNNEGDEYSSKDFKELVRWLDATSQFEEEVLRLENWKSFFKSEDVHYANHIIERSIEMALFLNEIGNKYLKTYAEDVEQSITNKYSNIQNKESNVYCLKGIIQIYYNMVSIQILNDVYDKRYTDCQEKNVIVPTILRESKKKCCSLRTNNGYKCKNCSTRCSVNKLHKLGEEKGFRVYSIDGANDIIGQVGVAGNGTGILSINSVLNIMSLEWKAIRLGYSPKALPIELCSASDNYGKGYIKSAIDWENIVLGKNFF